MRMLPFIVQSLHTRNQKYFLNKKTIQFFDRFATYSGSNPFRAPAITTFAGMPEMIEGAYYPTGGMRSIADALYSLCIDMGVQFEFNSSVNSIETKDGAIQNVVLDSKSYQPEMIVYAGDAVRLPGLLGKPVVNSRFSMLERSTSAIVFYWEVKGSYESLGLHNILFSKDYKKEYEELRRGLVPEDPTLYINITCKKTTGHASKGTENWFVMVNVPAGINDVEVLSLRDRVIKRIESLFGGYLTILNESYTSPSRLMQHTGSWKGAIYGQSSNSTSLALRRPPYKVKGYATIYRVGGTVHPGGGIPLSIRSAKILADKL
jgi:phytoene dehydrogenase-like protein